MSLFLFIYCRQKYGEISEKYKRLKEQFVKSAEASKSKDYPKLPEQRPAEAIQESKNQDSQLLFSTHAWVAPLAKESQGVEKPKTKPITFRENKENLLHQEKPDACKTQ